MYNLIFIFKLCLLRFGGQATIKQEIKEEISDSINDVPSVFSAVVKSQKTTAFNKPSPSKAGSMKAVSKAGVKTAGVLTAVSKAVSKPIVVKAAFETAGLKSTSTVTVNKKSSNLNNSQQIQITTEKALGKK